jgi:hypothetical protein
LNQSGQLRSSLLRYWTMARNQSFAVCCPPEFFNNIAPQETLAVGSGTGSVGWQAAARPALSDMASVEP